ncbi:MAG: AAA family ATPase [Ruminococcus sp.]|nr:AAA family ATPase [Ruminococcus sp.]
MNISRGRIHTAQKVVIYGPEGIGKSTFASMFPEPLFCDTEGSTKALDVMRFDRPDSAQMIYECIDYVKAHPDACRTFVLDTADWAEKLLSKKVCAAAQNSGIEDFGYGKGYTYLMEEFGKLLNQLEDLIALGVNVVVTAHAELKKFEQPDEAGAYDRWSLKLTKQDSSLLKEWADAVLFVNYKTYVEKTKDNKHKASGGRRVMYTAHHPCWDAKNRWGLPDECDFDYSVIAPFIPAKGAQSAPAVPTVNTSAVDALIDSVEPRQPSAPPEQPTVDDLDGIPKPLAQLMTENDVTEDDVRLVVSQQGYYPFEARVKDYDPAFIEGCLVAAWPQVFSKIMANKDLPFE